MTPLLILLLLAIIVASFFWLDDMQASTGSESFTVIPSSVHCSDSENFNDRRCVFRDVYMVGKVLWVVSNTSIQVPQLLCTSIDTPDDLARKCSIERRTTKQLNRLLSKKHVRVYTYDTGILFSRLCPWNPYHVVFEEFMPIYEMITNTPELAHWLAPTSVGMSQLLLLQDKFHNNILSDDHGRLLFPNAQIIQTSLSKQRTVFHVKFLVAGTRASCVHAHHCTKGKFLTPDIGSRFRRFALQQSGFQEVRPKALPRVTVVQRNGSRIIANIDAVIAKVKGILVARQIAHNVEVKVVDFGKLPIKEQVLTTMGTDILIMVHGGAYGNVIFLPRHAVVVDFYPYSFLPQLHGYVMNGIQLTAPSMQYGYRRVESNDSFSVLMEDGYCLPPHCAAINTTLPFHYTKCLHADVGNFAAHLEEVIQAWCYVVWSKNPRGESGCAGSALAAQEVYALPSSTAEFNARTKELRAQFQGDPTSCDRRVKCDAATRQRFQTHPQCKVQ
eukprot:EG_transcript_8423